MKKYSENKKTIIPSRKELARSPRSNRPTYLNNHEIDAPSQERRLYELIWKRTIASQMSDAELEKNDSNHKNLEQSRKICSHRWSFKIDGFLRVYHESQDEESDTEK